MRARKIRPMLAHPERIREVQLRPECLAILVDIGLLLQVDADALAGGHGPFAQETALRLLRSIDRPRDRFDLKLRTVAAAGEALGAETLAWGREALGLTIN